MPHAGPGSGMPHTGPGRVHRLSADDITMQQKQMMEGVCCMCTCVHAYALCRCKCDEFVIFCVCACVYMCRYMHLNVCESFFVSCVRCLCVCVCVLVCVRA